jgi:hypothetical protein
MNDDKLNKEYVIGNKQLGANEATPNRPALQLVKPSVVDQFLSSRKPNELYLGQIDSHVDLMKSYIPFYEEYQKEKVINEAQLCQAKKAYS